MKCVDWSRAVGSKLAGFASASDELVYYSQLMLQVFGKKLPIYIFTDSKSLKDSIYSTTLVKEESLRICIANIKQWVEDKTVSALRWVDTKIQIADVLTKANAPAELIRYIFSQGRLSKQIYEKMLDVEHEVNAETFLCMLSDVSRNYPKYSCELMYNVEF